MADEKSRQEETTPLIPQTQKASPMQPNPLPPPAYSGSTYQTKTNATVITTQPQALYIDPRQRSRERLPMIGFIISAVMLTTCLSFGNIFAFVCLIPAFVFAILGYYAPTDRSASNYGKLSIAFNIFNIVFWIIGIIVMTVCLITLL